MYSHFYLASYNFYAVLVLSVDSIMPKSSEGHFRKKLPMKDEPKFSTKDRKKHKLGSEMLVYKISGIVRLNVPIYFTSRYHMNMKGRVYTHETKETENNSLMKMI